MSTIVRAKNASFRRGAGSHIVPLVAASDLLMGYDMRDYAIWRTGLVAGQMVKTYMMDGGKVESSAGISQSPDGLGVSVADNAQVDYIFMMPNWDNRVAGRTMMVLAGFRPHAWTSNRYCRALRLGTGLALGFVETVNQITVGAAIDQPNTHNQKDVRVAVAQMIVTRANGDATWTTDIPDSRFKVTNTDTELAVAEPLQLWSATNPVFVTAGNDQTAPATTTYRLPFTLYQVAIWNRKLTDAEVAEQYQRSRLRFPGVLM